MGNTRVVLTDEQQIDAYPAATMETAQATTEEALYQNLETSRSDKPSNYPVDTYTDPLQPARTFYNKPFGYPATGSNAGLNQKKYSFNPGKRRKLFFKVQKRMFK